MGGASMSSHDPMVIIDLGPDKPRQTGPRRVLPGRHIDVGCVITPLDDEPPDPRPPGAMREASAPKPGDTEVGTGHPAEQPILPAREQGHGLA